MEVLIDILIILAKVFVHLLEPAILMLVGFWRWWTTEFPEVIVYEGLVCLIFAVQIGLLFYVFICLIR